LHYFTFLVNIKQYVDFPYVTVRLQPKLGNFYMYLGKDDALPTKDHCLLASDNNIIFFSNDYKYSHIFEWN